MAGLLVVVACAGAVSGAMINGATAGRGSLGISLQFDPADATRTRTGTPSVRDRSDAVELDPTDLAEPDSPRGNALPWTVSDHVNQQLPLDFSQTKAGRQGNGAADFLAPALPGVADEEIVLSQFEGNSVESGYEPGLERSVLANIAGPESGIGDVPEPSSILLFGGTLLGLAFWGRKTRR